MENYKHTANTVKDILAEAETVLGVLGVSDFEAVCHDLRCNGIERHCSSGVSWLVVRPVEELDSYGIFVSVDPLDNRRAFWLDRCERDNHQQLINGS